MKWRGRMTRSAAFRATIPGGTPMPPPGSDARATSADPQLHQPDCPLQDAHIKTRLATSSQRHVASRPRPAAAASLPFRSHPPTTPKSKKIIATLGATGAQGGGLVRAILNDPSRGFAARAIVRDPNSD